MPVSPSHLRTTLPPGPEAVRAARAVARELPLPPEVRADVELLVGELVANAVQHAGAGSPDRPADLGVEMLKDGRVRVEVVDRGAPYAAAAADPGPGAPRGRGLLLVDRIARRWGVERWRYGNVTWFEVEGGEADGA